MPDGTYGVPKLFLFTNYNEEIGKKLFENTQSLKKFGAVITCMTKQVKKDIDKSAQTT